MTIIFNVLLIMFKVYHFMQWIIFIFLDQFIQFSLIFILRSMFGFLVIFSAIFHGFSNLDFIDFLRKTLISGSYPVFLLQNQVFVTLFDDLDLRVEMLDFSSVKNSGKFGYGTVVFYWTRWCLASSYPPPCLILFELD